MRVMWPAKPYCLSTAAAVPPAWPAPTIRTCGWLSLMRLGCRKMTGASTYGCVMVAAIHHVWHARPYERYAKNYGVHSARPSLDSARIHRRGRVRDAADRARAAGARAVLSPNARITRQGREA